MKVYALGACDYCGRQKQLEVLGHYQDPYLSTACDDCIEEHNLDEYVDYDYPTDNETEAE